MSDLYCPACGQVATVLDRFVTGSTDGAVEHVRMICPERHYEFTSLESVLARTQLFAAPADGRQETATPIGAGR